MKFTVSQSELNRAMQFVASAIDGKSTLPVMSNVLITADADSITLSGTNGELEKLITISADVKEHGETTVPAKKMTDFAKNADPSKDVTLELKNAKASIKSGRAKWQLNTLPAKEYPEFMSIDESESIECDIALLVDAVKRCSPTMANNDTRYYLNGMLFDIDGTTMTVVATDGHRMNFYEMPISESQPRQIIIPRASVNDIVKMISKGSEASIVIGKDNIKVSVDGMVMYSKLVDGRYPDYKRVVPSDCPVTATINTEEFRSSVRRTIPITTKINNGILFGFAGDSLTISATNEVSEQGTESMPCHISGGSMEIGFNGAYVMDALSSINEENTTINMSNSSSSVIINEGPFSAVLMPVRF
jgi:DNA polymerase-3 subunit beta